MSKVKSYIEAFRLRTLPLSLSSIFMGSMLAAYNNMFSFRVALWATITTVFLQILSNLANDYGDAVSGADNAERIGPERMVASGNISKKEMKNAIIVFSFLSLVSGIILLFNSSLSLLSPQLIVMFIVGIAAIAAAIKYTVGKNPYGYKGYGDIFVFIFFGLVGVLGTYFLHTSTIKLDLLLPASAIGFLSMGVLNLNNMRDHVSDAKTGKHTLVVKNGLPWAKKYHIVLIALSFVCLLVYNFLNLHCTLQFLFVLPYLNIVDNLKVIWNTTDESEFNPQLKKLSLNTLAIVLCYGGTFVYNCLVPFISLC